MNLDAGETSGAYDDRQGQALEEREIDMHVERLGLESGEAVGNQKELLAHGR